MYMVKRRICFVNGTSPMFNGGIGNYQKNLINYLKNENLDITWLYKSDKHEDYLKGGIKYVGLKCNKLPFIDDISFNIKARKYLNKNYFDVINSHAIWGYWMKKYKKKDNQKIIHTYHGATYPYYRIHLKRFGVIKRILLSPLLIYGYLIEKPPMINSDRIICVSEKVKRQIEETYRKRKNIEAIRTGVNLKDFKLRDKNKSRKSIGLEKNKIYGLYIAKGGYWIKGLDRVVKVSEEIYKENKNYRLIVAGSDKNKVKNLIKRNFIIYKEGVSRDEIPYYYNSSDFFFCLSRYEGGAPTLVVSEAMASGCLIISSRDAEQEILKEDKNCIMIDNFDDKDAKRIVEINNNKQKKQNLIDNSIKAIKDISLEKWGRNYLEILVK